MISIVGKNIGETGMLITVDGVNLSGGQTFKPKGVHTLCPTASLLGVTPMAGLKIFLKIYQQRYSLQGFSHSKSLGPKSSLLEG